MRRIRPLDLLALLSLLLCAASAISWAASYRAGVGGFDEFPQQAVALQHWRGAVRFVLPLGREEVSGPQIIPFPAKTLGPGDKSTWTLGGFVTIRSPNGDVTEVRNIRLDESASDRLFRATTMNRRSAGTRVAGIEWRTGRRSLGPVDTSLTPAATFQRWAAVVVPHAYLVGMTAVLPAWRAVAARRRRRRNRRGLCPRCGYDLRASTGVCPECGAAAT